MRGASELHGCDLILRAPQHRLDIVGCKLWVCLEDVLSGCAGIKKFEKKINAEASASDARLATKNSRVNSYVFESHLPPS